MAEELKRTRLPEATPRALPLGDVSLRAQATPRPSAYPQWFDALEPGAPQTKRREVGLATPIFVAALVIVAVVRSIVVRVLLPVALAAAAIVVLVRGRRARPKSLSRARRRGLALADDRLDFVDGAAQTLVYTDAPFGVTLVTNARRDALVALLSSSAGTFSFAAALDGRAPAADDEIDDPRASVLALLDAASTSADGFGLDAIGPDGAPLVLSPRAFAAVVAALASRSRSCLSRLVLSDARGVAVTLDDGVLAVGDRAVDLTEPIEWRPLLFQEAFGPAVARYQGTWVKQDATEFVLVSLLPALESAPRDVDLATLDRGALRDLRLMQASIEQPPPTEQRVAIERVFMLPLRAALDGAPRAPRPHGRALA